MKAALVALAFFGFTAAAWPIRSRAISPDTKPRRILNASVREQHVDGPHGLEIATRTFDAIRESPPVRRPLRSWQLLNVGGTWNALPPTSRRISASSQACAA